MNGKVFLDTNLFIYTFDDRDPIKRSIARELIRTATLDGTGVISYQVVQEFFNVILGNKIPNAMRPEDAPLFLASALRPLLAVHSSVALFADALSLKQRFRLSWYDSLIVAAAQQANCKILYTEDLQHNQRFGELLIQNPFL